MGLLSSVSAVVAGVSASAVKPAASVSLDTTGRFNFVFEIVGLSDATAYAVAKQLSDSISLSDTPELQTVKSLVDSVSLSDEVLSTLTFFRGFDDLVVSTDTQFDTVDKSLADAYSVFDADVLDITKQLFDGVAMNDAFDATDGSIYVFTKGANNIVFATDINLFTHDKSFSDMIEVVDEGLWVIQGYCDLTYFAEDYVGQSSTFS